MREVVLVKEDPQEVLRALRGGELTVLEQATDEPADEFVSFALEEGLLQAMAGEFTDPRQSPEVSFDVILAASVAGCFAGLHALYQTGYALRSARLLAKLGLNATYLKPGNGISRKGTQDGAAFSGDVLRKLLALQEKKERDSTTDAGESWIQWFNQSAGPECLRKTGCRPDVFILDCTDLTVPLHNDRYQGSGVTTKDGEPKRGYKLATLRALLEEGGVLVEVAFGAINEHDLVLSAPLLIDSPHLQPGSMLLLDRGFIDGSLISTLKTDRQVDTLFPLRQRMTATTEAMLLADPEGWRPHPTRESEEIQRVDNVAHLWEECSVPLNGCIIRRKKDDGDYDHWVLVTTRLDLCAEYIVKHYQLRWEIEEDYRQLKDQGWNLDEFTSTKRGTLLYHIVCVLIAYNIYQIYAQTKRGRQTAGKSRRSWRLQQRKEQKTYLLLGTSSAYAVFETTKILPEMLLLPEPIRIQLAKLCTTTPHHDYG